jgi:hypothetical protein
MKDGHGRKYRCPGFRWKGQKERDHYEDIDGRIILKRVFMKIGYEFGSLAEDRDQWRALGNTLMNP